MIRKSGKKWRLDVRPNGVNGRRIVKKFDTKVEAQAYYHQLVTLRLENQGEQPFIDNRTLTNLIDDWVNLHGQSLKSFSDTANRLRKIAKIFNDPVAKDFNSAHFAQYRSKRLTESIKPATLNRELITLKAMFRELKRMGVIDYESSVLHLRKLPEKQVELSFLDKNQIDCLLKFVSKSKNDSLVYVVKLCLLTGARWSEAEGVKFSNFSETGVTFHATKNGKSRFVSLSKYWLDYFALYLEYRDFIPCYSAFRTAFKKSGLIVPDGQLSHILRHTFASHFIMNGGNIVALQKLLGHSNLNITMRYAHLAPSYMDDVINQNPLSGGNKVVIV